MLVWSAKPSETWATSPSEIAAPPITFTGMALNWSTEGGLEFINYDVEAPEQYRVRARTEQGFLAWVFMTLHEDLFDEEDEFETLPDAAARVGFRHYADWLAAYEAEDVGSFEEWDAFQDRFVAGIDALKTSRDRKPR